MYEKNNELGSFGASRLAASLHTNYSLRSLTLCVLFLPQLIREND